MQFSMLHAEKWGSLVSNCTRLVTYVIDDISSMLFCAYVRASASAQQSNLSRTRQLSLLEASVELLLGTVDIRQYTATSECGGT